MQPERLIIFDTTLRDGEQCPGASMNNKEKLEIARQLSLLKVDVIEAGFPAASPGDFESVQQIAKEIKGSSVAGLARALEKDVEAAARALEKAESPRIHIFLSTSKLHREHKLQKSKDEIIQMAVDAVKFGRKFCDDIEFSPEDASRTSICDSVIVLSCACRNATFSLFITCNDECIFSFSRQKKVCLQNM